VYEAMSTETVSPETPGQRCTLCGQEPPVDLMAPAETSGRALCPRCGRPVWFRVQELADAVILDLLPNMDLEATDLAVLGQAFLQTEKPPRIILNFALLSFVSSTFLARLVSLQRIVEATKGRLVLCGVNPVIREIFHITKLEGLFDFADGPRDALEKKKP
jgi:anti-anti-sigma factor